MIPLITMSQAIEEAENGYGIIIDIREKEDYTYLISVDGGVNLSTVQDVATAGADLAVTGSAFFLSEDKAEFVNKMNDLIRKCQ